MARSRTNYNVDTTTKILDTHKQFMGGLKTVDTDDSVRDFFLRDVENISLSEFGFLERRYGLVNDINFEFLVDVATEVDLPTGDSYYKDRLQGFFEYTRKNKTVEQIIFYNGRLYLNGVQVRQLYQYPSKFDAILGNYNNNISTNAFIEYLARVHNYTDFTDFNSIDDLFQTGRQVEGVRIDDRMFFFTGIYPIVYEGTGEFYLLPEYVTNFEQLALFSHNLHTADLDTTYTNGFPAGQIDVDISSSTRGYFGELGYAPMYPYMIGEGSGFELRLNYKLPPLSVYTTGNFTGFHDQEDQPTTRQYLELVPEIYYRPSGLSPGLINNAAITEVVGNTFIDETWTPIARSNIEYTVLSNLAPTSVVRDDPTIFHTELVDKTIPSFMDENRSLESTALYSTQQNSFNLRLQNIPSGLNDILVVYKIYQVGYKSAGATTTMVETVIDEATEVIRNITFTKEKTNDYVNVVTDDEGNDILVPVYDPAALWSCNRVLNHYGKLMAYGSLIHPERVFIGHPTYVHYFPWFFTRDFDNDAQEPLQQITPFMNILVVQSETYSWGLKGIDAVLGAPNFYTPFVISPIYGTIAPKSVRPVRNQLFFLSQDGIVSIQSLYAIDEQYNVKHIDKNIENIVPLDPEAVAIQYDNQYWIHFPNTPNNITLRYHVDLKAWMKDTYFEYNGLDNDGTAVLSNTVFNGVYKYIREDDALVLITNPMRLGKNSQFVEDDENYRIMRLYVDYSIATDVKEIPRAVFETSFLDQDYPFNEKKYIEQKMQFTIQNEYHLGKEPIFRDESMTMIDIDFGNVVEDYGYTLYQQPLIKNHDYEILVPNQANAPYVNSNATIEKINVRLFDIQGNLIDNLEFKQSTPPMPSIYNFRVFSNNTVMFNAFNNDIASNTIYYSLDNGAQSGTIPNVPALEFQSATLSGVSFGSHTLELFSTRQTGASAAFSDRRVLHFQVPDGVYDEDVFTPIIPSLSPVQLSAVTFHISATDNGEDIADRITVSWEDQNNVSEKYRYRYRKLGGSILGSLELTATTFDINFTQQQAIDNQLDIYEIEVEAYYENQWSVPAIFEIKLEYLDALPTNVTDLTDTELIVNTNERIKFFWTDVDNESSYRLYYKYANDTFATLNDYPATQEKVLNAGTELYLFDTNGNFPNMVQIPKNAILDVLLRPVNQIGPAPNDATRQGMLRAHYPIDEEENPLVIEPIDGQAGFKVTIPEALKETATNSGYVFEKAWEVEYYDMTVDNSFSDPAQNSLTYQTNNTKNYFEVTDLEPETEYRVRFRGRYDLNGVDRAPLPFQPSYYITVTTGDEELVPATNPSLNTLSQSQGSSAGTAVVNFSLRNNHNGPATIYYKVTTNPTDTVTVSSNSGSFPNLASTQVGSVSNFSVNDGTTYYIRYFAVASGALDSAVQTAPANGFTTPSSVTASFISNGGTPSYTAVSGYNTGLGFYVTSPGTPSRSGFSFNGWSPSLPRYISSSTSFTAQWTSTAPTTFTASYFVTQDGSTNFYTSRSVVSGQFASTNLPPNPSASGYTFGGWDPNPNTTVMNSNRNFTGTLTPVSVQTYTVTFNYWNGSSFGNHSSQTGVPGTTINYPSGLPDSPGGVFAGWSPNPSTIPSENITVFAEYLP